MEKERITLLQRWKQKADNDLQSIQNEWASAQPVTDVICFHAQQAVEKYLKLFLILHDVAPQKTHNIGMLLQACARIDHSFTILFEVAYLTDYAVELRYPDSFYITEQEEAQEAYRDALAVRDFDIKKCETIFN